VQPVKRRWRQQRRDVTKQISDTQCSAVLIATPTARPVPPWARDSGEGRAVGRAYLAFSAASAA
jgi:hypothetical protein